MVLNEPLPVEIDDLLARRRALGQDTFDEVWHGEYHMNPAPNRGHARIDTQLAHLLYDRAADAGLVPVSQINVGISDNFRVPDAAYLRDDGDPSDVWLDDAAIVVEVVSPNDESYDKFDHYAEFGVDEVIIVDPMKRTVELFARPDGEASFAAVDRSELLGISAAEIAHALDWP